MKKNDSGMSITSIALRPNIRVAADTNEQHVRRLVEIAHSECYVAEFNPRGSNGRALP